MSFSRPELNNFRWSLASAVSGFALTAAVLVCVARQRSDESLPFPAVSSVRPRPLADSCIECHKEADGFESVPHAVSLRSARNSEIRKLFEGGSLTVADDVAYRFYEQDGALWMESDGYPKPLPVQWFFGSGHHAITPVSTWLNSQGQTELLELAVSWYPEAGLNLTLGRSTEQIEASIGIDECGKWHSTGQAVECFGCHSNWLPTVGDRIDFDRIQPGLSCARCHLGSGEHVASEGGAFPAGFSWSQLSPLDSVNRCGNCHRRADQMTADELTESNLLLVRFAPAALTQSRCFLEQGSSESTDEVGQRMDCMTCHDPHVPASTDPQFYSERCRSCHSVNQNHQAKCPDLTTRSNCLPCHMPKVEIHPQLSFTDHWIRIRESSSPQNSGQ